MAHRQVSLSKHRMRQSQALVPAWLAQEMSFVVFSDKQRCAADALCRDTAGDRSG